MNGPNPVDYGWWLASRSAGIVALHRYTIVAWLLAVIHTLGAGTDAGAR